MTRDDRDTRTRTHAIALITLAMSLALARSLTKRVLVIDDSATMSEIAVDTILSF